MADALSRLPADIKTSKIHAYESPEHLKDEEFILSVTKPLKDLKTDKPTTDCKGETNIWTAYRIQYDSVESKQKNLHELNPNAAIFVPSKLENQKITAPVTPLYNQGQQNLLNVIVPTRRSNRIAARKTRSLQQQAAHGQRANEDQNNATKPTSNDEKDDSVGDHAVDHNADQQQTLKDGQQIDDFDQ